MTIMLRHTDSGQLKDWSTFNPKEASVQPRMIQ